MAALLSKSRLIAFLQCHKRLWLQEHGPELDAHDARTEQRFQIGHKVGDVAKLLYDPARRGIAFNAQQEGFASALARSLVSLNASVPLFEAGFATRDAVAFADVMLPVGRDDATSWRMVEVKSGTSLRDHYLDDVAIQAAVARDAGVPLAAASVALVDSDWVYPGGGDYRGLLVEKDVTADTFPRHEEVQSWITTAKETLAQREAPKIHTGRHCGRPFACEFRSYCEAQEPKTDYPVDWLPRLQSKATKAFIESRAIIDMRDVPDEYLSELQKRVKTHTLSGIPYFDGGGAARALEPHKLPALFLDFETVVLPVPVWAGTRPYQQIPFQFSLHRLEADGRLAHFEFLDLSGNDPTRHFAEALVSSCGREEPIFVYNRSFEASRIRDAADRFPDLAPNLLPLLNRLVDLLPIATAHYYHPSQQGSWSIKKLLPAIAPDLNYDSLSGVQDGEMAMIAFREAIHPSTPATRRAQLAKQLADYCHLDTLAMLRVWQFLSGQ